MALVDKCFLHMENVSHGPWQCALNLINLKCINGHILLRIFPEGKQHASLSNFLLWLPIEISPS